MTEAEWRDCVEPTDLLRYLDRRASERKLRLFACACCQRVWPLLTRSAVHEAVHVAERFADGLATSEELRAGWQSVRGALASAPLTTKWEDALMAALHTTTAMIRGPHVSQAAESAARALDHEWRERRMPLEHSEEDAMRARRGNPDERLYQSKILRDLFSWQPVLIDPDWQSWQHGQVVQLAQTIYDEERFQDLVVLADALEEAGCENATLLAHCRSRGPHVRGCWALDRLLGYDE